MRPLNPQPKQGMPERERKPLGVGRKSEERGSTFKARGTELQRSSSPKRSGPIKTSPAARRRHTIDRDWDAAWAKVAREGTCRACSEPADDPAHIVPRSRIRDARAMDDRNIVPLCRVHHEAQHKLKLWFGPLLTTTERAYVIELVGEGEAEVRLYGRGSLGSLPAREAA